MSESGRLSVTVSPGTWAALDLVAGRDDVSITEALRRLVGYGELVYRTVHVDGADVLTRYGSKIDRVELL